MHGGNAAEGLTEQFIIATVDTALYAQNLVVAAESAGLGICYIGALRNDPARVTEILDLPQQVYPVFGMCLGYPDQDPEVKPRLPLSVVLKENGYNTDGEAEAIAAYDERMRAYYAARTDNQEGAGLVRTDGRAAGQAKGARTCWNFCNRRASSRADIAGRKAMVGKLPNAPDGVLASRRGETARFSGSGSSPPSGRHPRPVARRHD